MDKSNPPVNQSAGLHRDGYRLVFRDEFDEPDLDDSRWLCFYLPQWSSRAQSKPRFHIRDSCLVLRIDPDQQPWCPAYNGSIRCSSVQTGVFSGPAGSPLGQHRLHPDAVVQEFQPARATCLFSDGLIEIRARVEPGPRQVAALWLIGFEDEPWKSGELCVMEIKNWLVADNRTTVGYGIHPFADPDLEEDFHEDTFPFSARDFHVYSAERRVGAVTFFIDGKPIRTIQQSPAYPLQLMLGVYDLPDQDPDGPGPVSDLFHVDYIRVWEPA